MSEAACVHGVSARPLACVSPRADVQEQHGELLYVSTGVDNCWSALPPHAWHWPLQKTSCMRCVSSQARWLPCVLTNLYGSAFRAAHR